MSTKENSIGNQNRELKRELSFRDIFFMSFGGQAPFLSMLTYATAVLLLSLYFSPMVVLIGTIVVLMNGLVVFFLSKRHTETGGYFNYAIKELSRWLGFETGWLYTFYSVLYASGYLAGSAFVLSYVLGVNPLFALLIAFIPASIFLLIGIKPSARYAIFAAAMEIVVLVGVIIVTLSVAHFSFYNPLGVPPSASSLFLGILFAIGIPTGYGAITPVSGEVKNAEKNVGRAAIMVILIGGLLEALVLYGIVDAGISTGSLASLTSSSVPVISIMKEYIGPYSIYLLLFAGINDGILGSLAFMTASSRNIYAMSRRKLLPEFLGKLHFKTGTPVIAGIVTIIIASLVLFPSIALFGVFTTFLALGTLSGLGNLAIHLSANFSLLQSLKTAEGKRVLQGSIALAAIAISGFVLVYSIATSVNYVILIFLGYIIIGFLAVESLYGDFSREKHEIMDENGHKI